ncbi:MAG: hypothetical protein HQL72_07525 [Magnetococcales bacterium]|nr:hypothetical protein [Magnetococcales bacterium]
MQQDIGIRDLYFQVILHLRGMWRNRWQALFLAWFICLTGWVSVAMMDDQYVSTATVKIEDPREDIKDFLSEESELIDVTREARKVLNGLLSRGNLLGVVGETDLAFLVNNEEDKNEILKDLRAQLTVSHSGENIYKIKHRHTEPRITQQVVAYLVSLLPSDSVNEYRGGKAEAAKNFLQAQVEEYETKVSKAEQELRAFKKKHILILPDEEGGYYERLQKFAQQQETDLALLGELEKRRDETKRQLKELRSKAAAPVAATTNSRTIELMAKLDKLFSQYYIMGGERRPLYTENHAEVIALRKAIAQLEKRDAEKQSQSVGTTSPVDSWELETNPVFRQLKMEASEIDVDLASVRARLASTATRIEKLKELEDVIPAMENKLFRLQGYLDQKKNKMLSMLGKETQASETAEIEARLSRFVRFRLVSRPVVPSKPVGPNRVLFSTIALIGALLAGLTLALFLAVIRPVFDSAGSLKRVLGLPVLGMVSMVDEGVGRGWLRSRLLFFLGLILLFSVYASLVFVSPIF